MNVLSLFDGMSCGQQAFERAGIKVDNYFASEIDKFAIQVTMANYPNTKQLGSVVNVDGYSLPKIDILIGGSPCQSFSFAGKRKGMSTKDEQEILTLEHYLELKAEGFEFEGQSYLFWEYMRLLNEVKPKYFLLENVMMGEKWEKVLSKAIGVKPIMINSSLLSAQNRQRLYWTNIGLEPQGLFGDLESIIKQPKDKGILLKDILEKNVTDKYFLSDKMKNYFDTRKKNFNNGNINYKDGEDKASCINASSGSVDISDNIIIHNTMPRSTLIGLAGTGPLSRNDGKTYCLDTGQTNAIEIFNNRRLNETISKHQNGLKHGTLIDSYNQTIHNDKSITISTRVNASQQTHIVDQEILGGDFRYDVGYRCREKGKSGTLCTNAESFAKINSQIRRLTPVECERLQTVKDNYTAHVSDSQRYKMLGNGWTVDIIVHILSYI
jgi:DNA (cytosine-5)-methyltransferase 3A